MVAARYKDHGLDVKPYMCTAAVEGGEEVQPGEIMDVTRHRGPGHEQGLIGIAGRPHSIGRCIGLAHAIVSCSSRFQCLAPHAMRTECRPWLDYGNYGTTVFNDAVYGRGERDCGLPDREGVAGVRAPIPLQRAAPPAHTCAGHRLHQPVLDNSCCGGLWLEVGGGVAAAAMSEFSGMTAEQRFMMDVHGYVSPLRQPRAGASAFRCISRCA